MKELMHMRREIMLPQDPTPTVNMLGAEFPELLPSSNSMFEYSAPSLRKETVRSAFSSEFETL